MFLSLVQSSSLCLFLVTVRLIPERQLKVRFIMCLEKKAFFGLRGIKKIIFCIELLISDQLNSGRMCWNCNTWKHVQKSF